LKQSSYAHPVTFFINDVNKGMIDNEDITYLFHNGNNTMRVVFSGGCSISSHSTDFEFHFTLSGRICKILGETTNETCTAISSGDRCTFANSTCIEKAKTKNIEGLDIYKG
jgi:hypothetical protein